MRIVLRLGGSVIASPVSSDLICRYSELLKDLKRQKHNLVVIVGGGELAREMIRVAGDIGLEEPDKDRIAISVSRLFAQLLLMKLGKDGCVTIPLTLEDVAKCLAKGKIVIMGGLKPGMTTDTVAALVIEKTKADLLIKATDRDGVYDRDPARYPRAMKLDSMKLKDLPTVLSEDKHRAGIHQIIDPEAVKILKRHKARIIVVNGFRPENVMAAINGEAVGTIID